MIVNRTWEVGNIFHVMERELSTNTRAWRGVWILWKGHCWTEGIQLMIVADKNCDFERHMSSGLCYNNQSVSAYGP